MDADQFCELALRNPVNVALLYEVALLELPDAWVVAGCLSQTVWNIKTGRDLAHGIDDYDAFYFDPDSSWEAEDRVIARLRATSAKLGVRIEVRNQARVHLWYETKHGTPYSALQNSTQGIDRFLTRCTQVGIQRTPGGHQVYAPFGWDDLDAMIVRPNPTPNFSADAYRRKTARWVALWPELTVVAPGDSSATSPTGASS